MARNTAPITTDDDLPYENPAAVMQEKLASLGNMQFSITVAKSAGKWWKITKIDGPYLNIPTPYGARDNWLVQIVDENGVVEWVPFGKNQGDDIGANALFRFVDDFEVRDIVNSGAYNPVVKWYQATTKKDRKIWVLENSGSDQFPVTTE